MNELQIG